MHIADTRSFPTLYWKLNRYPWFITFNPIQITQQNSQNYEWGTCSNEKWFDGSDANPPASITFDYPIAVDEAQGGVQKILPHVSPPPPPLPTPPLPLPITPTSEESPPPPPTPPLPFPISEEEEGLFLHLAVSDPTPPHQCYSSDPNLSAAIAVDVSQGSVQSNLSDDSPVTPQTPLSFLTLENMGLPLTPLCHVMGMPSEAIMF